jgi:hypothetical protein
MKKKLLLLIHLLALPFFSHTQNVGIGTTTPAASAQLDVSSTTKGLLIPRMTAAQRDAIANPATGLIIYQTDAASGLYYNSGSSGSPSWLMVSTGIPTWVPNVNDIFNSNSGSVGIGTISPTLAKLHVQGIVGNTVAMFNGSSSSQGISLVADYPGIYFNSYFNDNGIKSMSASGYPSFINSEQSSGDLTFNLSNVAITIANDFVAVPERMRITSSGNVGIGTHVPNAPLGFPATLGKKITLYPGTTGDIGFSVAENRLQIYSCNPVADVAIGYDDAGTFNEKFAVKPNGALAVSGNTGTGGQVLISNGSGAPSSWITPGSLVKTYYTFSGGSFDLTNQSGIVEIPLSTPFSISVNSKTRLLISGNFTASRTCTFCGFGAARINIEVDGNLANPITVSYISVGETLPGSASISNYAYDVYPGTHTVKFKTYLEWVIGGSELIEHFECVSATIIALPID